MKNILIILSILFSFLMDKKIHIKMSQIIYKSKFNSYFKIAIISVLMFSSFINCKKQENSLITENKVYYSKSDSLLYDEVNIRIEKYRETNNEVEYQISDSKIKNLKLILDLQKEEAVIEFNNKRIITQFNFTYDISIEDAISLIKVLESKDNTDFFILLPTTTEEFLTFELLKIDNSNDLKFYTSSFEINTHKYDDVPNFYKQNHLSLREKDLKYSIQINSFKSNGTLNRTIENGKNKQTNIVLEKNIKLNNIEYKIAVLQNLNKNNDFEQNHFKLPVQILKKDGENYKIYNENESLIFDNNNCVSEGFSDVKVKNNYFTIEGQSCFDNSIIFNYYITFKHINNQFVLYKYSEEYFDKSDHDKVIPTKHFTTKDFGEIKFEDVTYDFLTELRNR